MNSKYKKIIDLAVNSWEIKYYFNFRRKDMPIVW